MILKYVRYQTPKNGVQSSILQMDDWNSENSSIVEKVTTRNRWISGRMDEWMICYPFIHFCLIAVDGHFFWRIIHTPSTPQIGKLRCFICVWNRFSKDLIYGFSFFKKGNWHYHDMESTLSPRGVPYKGLTSCRCTYASLITCGIYIYQDGEFGFPWNRIYPKKDKK